MLRHHIWMAGGSGCGTGGAAAQLARAAATATASIKKINLFTAIHSDSGLYHNYMVSSPLMGEG
jgi:hypothetical protein